MLEGRRAIFDTSALITACKFTVRGRRLVAWILQGHGIVLPSGVAEEALRGKDRHEDAAVIAELIASKAIQAEPARVPPDSFLHAYELGSGEKEAICLYLDHGEAVTPVVTHDKLAYLVCDRMGVRKRLFLDLVLDLVRDGVLAIDMAREIIAACVSRYSRGITRHSLVLLEEVERQWQR